MNLNTPLPKADGMFSPVRIVRVPPGAEWHVQCAATRAATLNVHYIDGRTLPCSIDEGECRACSLGLSYRFEAYLAAVNHTKRCRQVVVLPATAYAALCDQLGALTDGGLLGRRLELVRAAGDRRGPLRVKDAGPHSERWPRPAGIDTPAILYRAWGVPPERRRKLG